MLIRDDSVIRLCKFSSINLDDPFFDSLKSDYPGFEAWFSKKSDEFAYTVFDESGFLQGFLYLKVEDGPIIDVTPPINVLGPIIKVGTFKINAHGTKLGERFIKKIFDYAVFNQSQYIYVTVFPKHTALIELLGRYGFKDYGNRKSQEHVLIKDFIHLEYNVCLDYPIINARSNKWLLGVQPRYHTGLFPDSKLNNEPPDLITDTSYTNSIHKIFVGQYREFPKVALGDIFVVYRTQEEEARSAWYSSVVTSICVVQEIRPKKNFLNFDDFFDYTRKHSVFDENDLRYWYNKSDNIYAIKMTYNVALPKRPTRQMLVEEAGLANDGYWGFRRLTDEQFSKILVLGQVYEGVIVY